MQCWICGAEEIAREASAVFLDVETANGLQNMYDQEAVLDEVLGDPKDVMQYAKTNLKKFTNREVCTVLALSNQVPRK